MDTFSFSGAELVATPRGAERLKDGAVRAAIDFRYLGQPIYTHSGIWTDATLRGNIAQVLADRTGANPDVLATDLARLERELAGVEIDSAATSTPIAAESILAFRTAREIAVDTPAAVAWIALPWLARSAITEIDGKVKAAGKTTFITHMIRAILTGRPFMGEPTRRTSVVYLSEQAPRSFREALRRADLLDHDDLHVLFWHESRELDWPALIRAATAKAVSCSAGLLVVDTLPQFAGLRGDDENNSGAALEALRPLQEAAALHNLAVAFVRHERKSGGDVGDSGRGSSAYAGGVDIVLSIRRADGNTRPSIRVIHSLSRFDETPDTLVIELKDGEYLSLGDEAAIIAREARTALLAALPLSEATAKPFDDLMEACAGVKRTAAQDALKELLKAGTIGVFGKGRKGDPKRYWTLTPDIDSAEGTGGSAESIRAANGALRPPADLVTSAELF